MNKEKKVNILIEMALKKKEIPAPNHYIKCADWNKDSKRNNDNL